jgi:hypothetical protein
MYIDDASLETSANWEYLFRKKHPLTSFPRNVGSKFLSSHGIFNVNPARRMVGKEYRSLPPQKIDGEWVEVLEVI